MLSCWKRTRYRLEWLGLSLATKLIPLCSRRACYRLAQLAGTLLSFLDRHHYHVALSNLEVAFGDQLSGREQIGRASCRERVYISVGAVYLEEEETGEKWS